MAERVLFSDFLQDPTTVSVADGDVVLSRRDGEDLLLTTVGRDAAMGDGLALVAAVLGRLAGRDRGLLGDLLAEQLPWLGWLPGPEREVCLRELVDDLAGGTGSLLRFHQDLVAWRTTAAIWSDRHLAGRLSGPFTGRAGEVGRPDTDG